MVLKLQQNICIHFELCIILLRFQSILSMTKNISRVVVYTQSVSDYIPNGFFSNFWEKHLQSSKQYNESVFQQIWGFLFNDPVIVNWGKINTTQQSNFEILNFETYNLPYDWASISHFRSKAYRTKKSVGHTIESNVS